VYWNRWGPSQTLKYSQWLLVFSVGGKLFATIGFTGRGGLGRPFFYALSFTPLATKIILNFDMSL